MTENEAARLTHAVSSWAAGEPSIAAAAVVGSWARGSASSASDLDLMVLTSDLDRWSTDDQWLRKLVADAGFTTSASLLEQHGVARSWRVYLGERCEIELTLASTSWAEIAPVDPGTKRVVEGGLQVLLDKQGRLRSLSDAIGC